VKKISHFDVSNHAWAKKKIEKSIRSDKVKIIFYSTNTHTHTHIYIYNNLFRKKKRWAFRNVLGLQVQAKEDKLIP